MIYNKNKYTPEELKRLQKIEIEILDEIVFFCNKNNIKYSLAYGTLLGAIRHKGFIPWDDDIDLMMLRKDYNRFRELWLREGPPGYELSDNLLHEDYHQNFIKIRKRKTTFVQCEYELNAKIPLGIFVDIFPFDRVAPKGIKRKLQYFACLFNMLFTRNYPSGSKGLTGIIEKLLLKLPFSVKKIIKLKCKEYIEKWNAIDSKELLFTNCTFASSKKYYPSNMFNTMIEIDFNGNHYNAINEYDTFLKINFGDYIKLPPENKRVSHYPIILDFEHEYFYSDQYDRSDFYN